MLGFKYKTKPYDYCTMEIQSLSNSRLNLVGRRYRVGRRIGYGSFGDIYIGTDIQTDKEVAIKLECAKSKHPQLNTESLLLNQLSRGPGIPAVKWRGTEGDYNIMVMELLGPSLEDLFNYCSRRFSLRTVLMLANQMLMRIEFIHSEGYIHRDVKPDNFLMGLESNANLVYLIDFGLARQYWDSKLNCHIPYKENKTLTGTARYASVNTHQGVEQSRRDDLESLGYVLMYFNRGSLPWQGMRGTTKRQKYERICEKKIATSIEELCGDFPIQFALYLNYCRSLKFEQEPDYNFLRNLFRDVWNAQKDRYKFDFDWTLAVK